MKPLTGGTISGERPLFLPFTQANRVHKLPLMKMLIIAIALVMTVALSAFAADKPAKSKKLLHVVSFKFKPEAKQEQIDEVVSAFRDLKKKIPAIKEFSWGTNVSPEKHDKGFTHGFVLGFTSEKDRDDYLVHPDHKAFGKIVGPVLADVFVIDYWAQE